MKGILNLKRTTIMVVAVFSVLILATIPLATYLVKNRDPEINIAIVSDTHVMAESQFEMSEEFMEYASRGQKLLFLSEAIFKTMIDEKIEDKSDFLLITGDLTDDGGRLSHELVASELRRYEQAGKKAFVVPGNHDINNRSSIYTLEGKTETENISAEEFYEIYREFGYDEAIVRDDNTLSYVAELDKNHRLIAIDCSFYEVNREDGYVDGRHSPNMTEELSLWCKAQVETAISEDKTPIGIIHFPALPHLGEFVYNTLGATESLVNGYEEFSEMLLDAGLKYLFSGHMHSQDIYKVEKDGKTLYDIETAALSNYPLPIRHFKEYKDYTDITTVSLNGIKEAYIPDFVSAEDKETLNTNLYQYAEEFVNDSMKAKVMNKIDTDTLLALFRQLGIDRSTPEAIALAEDVYNNMLLSFFDLPMYGEGLTVSGIASTYDIDIPVSSYESVWDLAMSLLKNNYRGDESFDKNSPEATLLRYSIYSAFYIMDDYDLFGKLSVLQPELQSVDLSLILPTLFQEDKLDLTEGDILKGILKSLRSLGSFSNYIDFDNFDPNGVMDLAKLLLSTKILLNYDFSIFIGEDNTILFKDIFDVFLIDEIGGNLLIDEAPQDNNLRVYNDGREEGI